MSKFLIQRINEHIEIIFLPLTLRWLIMQQQITRTYIALLFTEPNVFCTFFISLNLASTQSLNLRLTFTFLTYCILFFFSVNEGETDPWGLGRRLPCRRGGGGALFNLLLGAQIVGMAILFGADDSVGVQASTTLAGDQLVMVVFLGQCMEGRLNDASSEPRHQVQGRLFLDIVV